MGRQNNAISPNDKARLCWNMASVSEDEGEIVLYGDILSQQPIDWWTGEPEPGLWITPEGFMEDLETVRGKSKITVKLNSCGGDLYTGIAIHNAIKALSSNVTVIVEGIAASAASIIMCAGDTVQVYPGSTIMIHEPSCFVFDSCNRDQLKQVIKMLEAGINSAAAVYNAKTGTDVETLKNMMHKETWMTGQEAVEKGFADELINGTSVDMKLEGKEVLMVAGIRHDIRGLHIPERFNIPTISAPEKPTQATSAGIDQPGSATGEIEEGGSTEMYNSIDELRAAMPDLVSQIEASAVEAAVAQERERQQRIDEIAASVADAALVNEAKYENPCTAEQLAFKAMQKQAQLGAQHLQNTASDNADSGVQEVQAVSPKAEESKKLTKEERMALGRADAKAALNKKEEE